MKYERHPPGLKGKQITILANLTNPPIVDTWCRLFLPLHANLDKGGRPLQVPCNTSFLVSKSDSSDSRLQPFQLISWEIAIS